jgi:hypothetical protein
VPTVARLYGFNGTTWDQLQVDANKFLKVTGGVAQGSTTAGQTTALVGAAVTTAAPSYTTGQTSPLSLDTAGELRVAGGVPQASTTAGQNVALIGCAVTTGAPTYTTAQTDAASCDTSGGLRVSIISGGGSGGTASSFAAAFPATGTAIGVKNGANMVNLTADASSNLNVNVAADSLGTLSTAPQAIASGGATPGHFLSAATNNSTSVKGSAGTLYTLEVVQTTTTLGDLRLYDSAAAPTCSSATGVVKNYAVQSNATSPGFIINFGPAGITFANGIGICLTGAVSDSDNTSFVTGVQVNYSFK